MCLYTYVLSHDWKVSAFIAKSTSDVFVDFRPPYWWTKVVHQHGDSIQNSIKLRATHRQITQKRCITQTWDLERLFMYIGLLQHFHVLGFFHWTASNIFFYGVTVKTIYIRTAVTCVSTNENARCDSSVAFQNKPVFSKWRTKVSQTSQIVWIRM